MMGPVRTYKYSTPEGFTVRVDLTKEGLEDGYMVQDWEVSYRQSPGYEVDDVEHDAASTYIKTSLWRDSVPELRND